MRISIYQLKPRHQDLYKLSFDEFKAQSGDTPFIHQYNKIFTGVVDDSVELEDLFDILSNDLPDTYRGKDFGVSDIIGIETDGKVLKAGNYYYCDNIGWTKARQFTEQNESLEESLDNIISILNNILGDGNYRLSYPTNKQMQQDPHIRYVVAYKDGYWKTAPIRQVDIDNNLRDWKIHYLKESINESDGELLIEPELSEDVINFINTPDEELNFDLIKTVCDEYNSDTEAMSKLNQMDDIDAEIANHKAFYKKWRPLANRVRRFEKISVSALPGIKQNSAVRIKAQQMLRDISYGFPYGWQFG